MIIRYKKGRSRFYLILSIIWFILLVVNVFYSGSSTWTFWIWVILPLANIAYYMFEYFNQYLKIENGFIYRTSVFPKKLELNRIQKIKKSAGDYIIETDQTRLAINASLIHRDSLKELERVLGVSSNQIHQEAVGNKKY